MSAEPSTLDEDVSVTIVSRVAADPITERNEILERASESFQPSLWTERVRLGEIIA